MSTLETLINTERAIAVIAMPVEEPSSIDLRQQDDSETVLRAPLCSHQLE